MDALQWMGAVRMRVRTADKNITIITREIHATHRLTSCEVKICLFVRNKSIIKMHLKTPETCSVHNNTFTSSEKVQPLLSPHITIFIYFIYLFRTVFAYKQCLICAYLSYDSDLNTFFHWRKQYYWHRISNNLKLKFYHKHAAFHILRC